jgi:hypothetical protein
MRLTAGAKAFVFIVFAAPLICLYLFIAEPDMDFGGDYDTAGPSESEIVAAIEQRLQLIAAVCTYHIEYMNDPRQEDKLWSVFDLELRRDCTG